MKHSSIVIRFLAGGLLAVLFTGCSPTFYSPISQNVPLFREKHEVRINTGLSTSLNLTGGEAQVAYAAGKNIAMLANAQLLKGTGEDRRWKGRSLNLEACLGYFRPLDQDFVLEVIGGAGMYDAESSRLTAPSMTIYNKHHKAFVQPAFGFTSEYFEISLSNKISFVRYKAPFTSVTEEIGSFTSFVFSGTPLITTTVRNEDLNYVVFEPAMTMRGGGEIVKVQLQVVYASHKIRNGDGVLINAGLCFNPNPRSKRAFD